MTPLDQAYAQAQKDPDKAGSFYNLFLNSTLYVPVWDEPEDGSDGEATHDSIMPVIVENESRQFLMIFDTAERLALWAQREISYVGVSGHRIVHLMQDPEVHWVLNAGTDFYKEFVADEIRFLKDSLEQTVVRPHDIPAGTSVRLSAPSETPPGFIDAMKVVLNKNRLVTEAFLAQISLQETGEKTHKAVVLRLAEDHENLKAAIINDLMIASREYIKEPDYIDIFIDDGEGLSHEITKIVEPFFIRQG